MKIKAALLLALCLSACDTQQERVTAAFTLYQSCIQGLTHVDVPLTTDKDVIERITYVDDFCTKWTIAWYPVRTGRPYFDLDKSDMKVLDKRFREPLLVQLEAELRLVQRQER